MKAKRSVEPVECRCARTRHVHGTATCYMVCGCGCPPCRAAATAQRAAAKARLREDGPAFVPLAPVREHVEMLRSNGIGTRRLAEVSGVPARTIQTIITGKRGTRDGQQNTLNRRDAELLQAVRPSARLVAGRRAIDVTGTRRRLQALATLGWSRAELARRAGVTPTTLGRLMGSAEGCSIASARAVHRLYSELWDQAAPPSTSQARAQNEARRLDWAAPMEWEDCDIDDPAASPSRPESEPAGPVERLDEVLFLARSGEHLPTAAKRAGYRSWAVAYRVAVRHGHPVAQLAARLELERAA